MPEAAERALVSVATAYRYFRTAEELWEDAALFQSSVAIDWDELEGSINAAGDDVEARLDVLVRALGWWFVDHEVVARQLMKASLDRWFAEEATGGEPRRGRPGARNRWNALVLEPLRDELDDDEFDALVEALGFVVGTEAVITLLDVLKLSPEAAKERQLATARWILRGGLADVTTRRAAKPKKKRAHA